MIRLFYIVVFIFMAKIQLFFEDKNALTVLCGKKDSNAFLIPF